MQMTIEARAWLDELVRRVLAKHPVRDPERAGLTYELMSHVHGAAERKAAEAGHPEITLGDMRSAVLDIGGEEELVRAFVQPLAKPVERVLFWRRAGAFAIDALLLGIVLTFVHGSLTVLMMPLVDAPVVLPDDDSLWGLMPWGYHPEAGVAGQILIAIVSAPVVLGYFAWFEAHEGRSLGKRALDLRVVRVDGQPMTYRESVIRSLAKLSPPILAIDTLVMLLAFAKEKQRVSDRIAETIVIRA